MAGGDCLGSRKAAELGPFSALPGGCRLRSRHDRADGADHHGEPCRLDPLDADGRRWRLASAGTRPQWLLVERPGAPLPATHDFRDAAAGSVLRGVAQLHAAEPADGLRTAVRAAGCAPDIGCCASRLCLVAPDGDAGRSGPAGYRAPGRASCRAWNDRGSPPRPAAPRPARKPHGSRGPPRASSRPCGWSRAGGSTRRNSKF